MVTTCSFGGEHLCHISRPRDQQTAAWWPTHHIHLPSLSAKL